MGDAWITVGLDVMGETQVARQFQIAEEWTHDLSEPLSDLMDDLIDSVRAQFDTVGAASGDLWAPLSDEYSVWKATHYPGRPTLVRDGGMKGAMLNRVTAVHVGPEQAVYEPLSHIAGYHQKGADWIGPAWGHGHYPHHLPQRKMVDLSEEWKHEHVDRTFARWIARKLAEGRTVSVPLAA